MKKTYKIDVDCANCAEKISFQRVFQKRLSNRLIISFKELGP